MTIAREIIATLGGTRSAAKKLGKPPSTIQTWKRKGVFPVSRLMEIEEITGIPREKLRPDLFERPAPAREVV